MAKRDSVPAAEFIRAWQTSSCLREVCERTGMSVKRVSNRACVYRRLGIRMKTMPGGRKSGRPQIDVDDLRRYAESFLKDDFAEVAHAEQS